MTTIEKRLRDLEQRLTPDVDPLDGLSVQLVCDQHRDCDGAGHDDADSVLVVIHDRSVLEPLAGPSAAVIEAMRRRASVEELLRIERELKESVVH